MPKGRPVTKTAAERKATGTARKDRPTIADAPPPPRAMDMKAPAGLSPALKSEWDDVTSDLDAVGVVCRTDLDRLRLAFSLRTNAEEIQKTMTRVLKTGDTGDISKLQTALASAVKTADSLVVAVERSVKLRPKKEKADAWEA